MFIAFYILFVGFYSGMDKSKKNPRRIREINKRGSSYKRAREKKGKKIKNPTQNPKRLQRINKNRKRNKNPAENQEKNGKSGFSEPDTGRPRRATRPCPGQCCGARTGKVPGHGRVRADTGRPCRAARPCQPTPNPISIWFCYLISNSSALGFWDMFCTTLSFNFTVETSEFEGKKD